jgi:isoquinoline 1-oxidoreductase beta subunit
MKTSTIKNTDPVSYSRRDFLKLTVTAAVGGGLLLGFGLPLRAVISDESSTGAPFAPNAFLRIDRAGKVTFVMPFIEGSVQSYVQKRCLSSKRGMVMVRG